MKQEHARSLFEMAGLKLSGLYELPNRYWPNTPDYIDLRKEFPWWLALTVHGPMVIGWRKRVIMIDWSDTPLRYIVTKDNVTKSETMVHAYFYASALTYLTNLVQMVEDDRIEAVKAARDAEREAEAGGVGVGSACAAAAPAAGGHQPTPPVMGPSSA